MKILLILTTSMLFTVMVHSQHVGINTINPNRPLTIKGTGNNCEMISFLDSTNATRFHINLAAKGLNFVRTGFKDYSLFLDSLGKVGIGTSSPNSPLHVSHTGVNSVVSTFGNLGGYSSIMIHNDSIYSTLGSDFAGGFVGTIDTNYPFRIQTGAIDRIVVSGERGHVGIGTSTPGFPLQVSQQDSNSVIAFFRNLKEAASIVVHNGITYASLGTDNEGGFVGGMYNNESFRIITGGADRIYVSGQGGDVGIGTMNPIARLHVSSADANLGYFETSSADANISIKGNNHQIDVGTNPFGGMVGTLSASDLSLHTNYLKRLVIKHSTGRIGIGTDEPQRKLHVMGDALFTEGIYLPTTGGTATSLNYYEEATISSNVFNGANVYQTNYNYLVVRTGRQVTITLPRDLVNMNITPVTELVLNGLPARFRPATDAIRQSIPVMVNGLPGNGVMVIKTDGTIGLRANISNPNASWFSVSNGGFYACTISYNLP